MKLTSPPELPYYMDEEFTRSAKIQKAIVARIAAIESKKDLPDLRKDFN